MPLSQIEILWSDEHLVAVNKPSGLLVHRGWDNDREVAMTLVRDAIGERVQPVHRLDRGTSGVLLFARSAEMTRALGDLFASGEVKKTYWALVRGKPPAEGVIDSPVPRREDGPRVPARTRFRLLEASTVERCAVVEAIPETGRLHQIRRHLKHLGHPILGDVNYGRGELNRHYRAHHQLHRLALHARSVELVHPVTAEKLLISAPLPADLAASLSSLGLRMGLV